MSTRKANERLALLQGTLDVLILKTLLAGPRHGHGIACAIEDLSGAVLLVDHGSLYPALQRLEASRLVEARWGVSENNRRARFYRLTKAGRRAAARETNNWHRLAAAIGRVLGPDPKPNSG
jgi:transcriptional regulator